MGSELLEQFTFKIQRDLEIKAPADLVFESILEQIGPGNSHPDGSPMSMKLEAWPGGRWFRDTGNNTGHFWGHVQVIKPPKVLEIAGPLFMSYPVCSHVQYRLTSEGNVTKLGFLHRMLGDIDPEHRKGMTVGWDHILKRIVERSTK